MTALRFSILLIIILHISCIAKEQNTEKQMDAAINQICFSISGRRENHTLIKANGELLFSRPIIDSSNEFYKSKLSIAEYNNIISSFITINPDTLNNKYLYESPSMGTNEPIFCITFLKNDSIIKTITGFEINLPYQIKSKCRSLDDLFAKQKVEKGEEIEKSMRVFQTFSFVTRFIFHLSASEEFYLRSKLVSIPNANNKFKPRYTVNLGSIFNVKNFETDGRHFKLNFTKDSSKIYDFGANFFEINSINKKITKDEHLIIHY